ncbi:MAG TPA: sulfite exporter TauE/SafE family protein [Actinomycetota bacterium]|nr:sulfite exporter TauE/SafE family protein [Actinomycetota bacterium]
MDGLGVWTAIAGTVALAATAQGLSGFGFSLVSIPLLALVVPVKAAVVGGAMLGLVLSGSVVVRDHGHVAWRSAGLLFAAAIAGMPIGVWAIDRVREQPLQVAIALIVLVFTVLLWRRIRLPSDSLGAELGVGFTSGVLSTSTGMSGPPLVIALQARGVTPSAFRATLAVVFLGGSTVSLALFARAGLVTHDAWVVAMAGIPGLAAGLVLGEWWFRRVDNERFRSIVLVLLVSSAMLSLVGALT